jgi:hypothetical protein
MNASAALLSGLFVAGAVKKPVNATSIKGHRLLGAGRLDTFCNPLVYTFADGREPAITPLSRAPAD